MEAQGQSQDISCEIYGRQSGNSCSLLFSPGNYYSTNAPCLYINSCNKYSRPICEETLQLTVLQECATLMTLYQWVPHAVSVSTHICSITPCQWLFCIVLTPVTCKYPHCLRPFLTSLWMALSSTKPGGSLRSSSLAPGYVANLTEWHNFRTFSHMLWGRVGMILHPCVSMSLWCLEGMNVIKLRMNILPLEIRVSTLKLWKILRLG
jgi:hypothetical protein